MVKKQLFIDAQSKEKEKREKNQSQLIERSFIDEVNRYLAAQSKLKLKDKVTFYRLFSTMINAGINISKSLEILKEQVDSPKLKLVLEEVEDSIKKGSTLSSALEKYPTDFGDAEIGMIKAGEVSGKLNTTLLNLAEQTEKSEGVSKKLKGALIYPAVIMFILGIVLYAVMTFVIPQIKEMFESFDKELPAITQALIDTSDYILANGGPLGYPNYINLPIYIVIFIFLFIAFQRTKVGKELIDNILLKVPFFGTLTKKVALAKMTRGLSTLLSSGIPMVKSLIICSNMIGNEPYRKRIVLIAEDVKIGISISDNLKGDYYYFPPMVISMIGVGEQTANLDKISMKIANLYEEEIDDTIKNLSSILEPVIIVVVGASVGGLVIAIMLPIMNLTDLVA
jgi:type IV pilus assembly protein PilC